MQPRIATGVIMTERHGRILLLKRASTAITGPDTWAIPGGKLDPGETLEQGAARELLEETSVKAFEMVRLPQITEDMEWGPDLHFVTHYFRLKRWSGTPKIVEPDKYTELRWVQPAEILERARWAKDRLPLFGPLAALALAGGLNQE